MSGFGFWSSIFNFAPVNTKINELLEDPDTPLEDLLNEDHIVNEFRSLNSKLVEYCTEEKVREMISYIIEEPPEDAEQLRGYKLPYVACEVLCTDSPSLLNSFFGKNPNKGKKATDTQVAVDGDDTDHNSQDLNDFSDDDTAKGDSEKKEEQKPEENGEQKKETSEDKAKDGEEKQENGEQKDESNASTDESNNSPNKDESGSGSPEKKEETEPKNQEKKAEDIENMDFEDTNEGEGEENSEEKKTEEKKDKKDSFDMDEFGTDNSEECDFASLEETPRLAQYFFTFLDAKELNVTLLGYFCRVFNNLMLRKPNEISKFLFTNEEIIDKFINHLGYRPLAECLVKLLSLENLTSEDTYFEQRIKKVKQLVELFNGKEENLDSEVLNNASQVVCELISKRTQVTDYAKFEAYFNSKECLKVLFEKVFRSEILIKHIVPIITTMLNLHLQKRIRKEANNNDDDDDIQPSDDVIVDTDTDEDALIFGYMADQIQYIADFLKFGAKDTQKMTYGAVQKPFGVVRLKLMEAIYLSIKLNIKKIIDELIKHKIFETMMRLMVDYEWNNLLHNQIEKIFSATIEGDNNKLRMSLMKDCKLVDFLFDATRETNYTMPNAQQRQIRRGYLGHLTNIAKLIEKKAETDNDIKELITCDKWNDFDDTYLRETQETNNIDLAGKGGDEDDQEVHVGNSMEETYGKFDSYFQGRENALDQDEDDEEVEDEDGLDDGLNDRADGYSPEKEVNTNVDNLVEFEDTNETWSKREADETNQQAHSDKTLWTSTFHFNKESFANGQDQPKENIYLEYNKSLEVVDLGAQSEEEFHKEYAENSYWSKTIDSKINPDDLLNEMMDF